VVDAGDAQPGTFVACARCGRRYEVPTFHTAGPGLVELLVGTVLTPFRAVPKVAAALDDGPLALQVATLWALAVVAQAGTQLAGGQSFGPACLQVVGQLLAYAFGIHVAATILGGRGRFAQLVEVLAFVQGALLVVGVLMRLVSLFGLGGIGMIAIAIAYQVWNFVLNLLVVTSTYQVGMLRAVLITIPGACVSAALFAWIGG
jgi:hypothetical protein